MRYFFLLFTIISLQCYAFIDITKEGYEQYQDIWIKGRVAKKANYNHNYCELRYQIIDKVLSRYSRPFTMLDIGAAQGYYSLRSAEKYPHSVFVMLEGNNQAYPRIGDQLKSICVENNLSNTILLQHKIDVAQIGKLSKCEHFDVVLALNILHWFGDRWRELATHIISMGYDIIIETPPVEGHLTSDQKRERANILNFLKHHKATLLGEVPRHTHEGLSSGIYHIRGKRSKILMKSWWSKAGPKEEHYIKCDYDQKSLTKIDNRFNSHVRETNWIPGINMISFLCCYGSYPLNEVIKAEIKSLSIIQSDDWMINNMIVQGKALEMIDLEDIYHKSVGGRGYSEAALRKTIHLSRARGEGVVKAYFDKVFMH